MKHIHFLFVHHLLLGGRFVQNEGQGNTWQINMGLTENFASTELHYACGDLRILFWKLLLILLIGFFFFLLNLVKTWF
jgi:hypothetical protein